MRVPRAILVTLSWLVVLAGCVSTNRPEACDEPTITIEVTVTESSMTPTDPAACRDQDVTLVVTSEVDGFLHIHGYDEALPVSEIVAGETAEFAFVAIRSGQFPIEIHPGNDPTGVGVGVFTVHEP